MNWQVSTISVQGLLCRWNMDCVWLCHCMTLKKKEGACASQTMEDCECNLHPLDFHCPFVDFYIDKRERRKVLQAPVSKDRDQRKDKAWFTGISPRGYSKACTSDSHELSVKECVSQTSASTVTANEGTSETRLFSHCIIVKPCSVKTDSKDEFMDECQSEHQ